MTTPSRCFESNCIDVTEYGEVIRVRSSVTGTTMQCTRAEWHAFLDDLAGGRWAHIGQEAVASC